MQVLFLSTSFMIALNVKDLGVVLSLVGATGSTIVSLILPGVFYFRMFKDEGPAWKRYAALAQLLAGVLIIPFCLYSIIT
jgi:amino acid permease